MSRLQTAYGAAIIVLVAYIACVGFIRLLNWLFADQVLLWAGLILFPVLAGVITYVVDSLTSRE